MDFNKTDTNKPLTFISWLEVQSNVSSDLSTNLNLYQQYLVGWTKQKKVKNLQEDNTITSLYIDLIKEITLNFSSEEEKRFIVNFDYSKKDNLDIIIPFFIQKLKSICLYYSLRRENLKEKISLLPVKGTNLSVSKLIKNILISNIESGFSQKLIEGKTTIPSLSAVNLFLDVKVEELYDNKNYFDIPYSDLETLSNSSKNNQYDNFNIPGLDSDLYTDFAQSIKNAINQYPIYVESLLGNLSVNLNLSGTELHLLKERDFIQYINSGKNEDLKINLLKRLAPSYASCDFYYLSTGSTLESVTSGTLFKASNKTSDVTQNILNKNSFKIAAVQSLDNIYSAYELGKFFTPDKTGILKYNTFDKIYSINYGRLQPNKLYIFPDPNVVESDENINGVSPIVYKVDVTWNKIGKESGFRFGDVISSNYFQLFYPYQSYSQDTGAQPTGLSVSYDNLDFWSGDKSSTWNTENNLWPGLDTVEKLPIDSRVNTLLINEGVLTDWYSDVYGNQFGLYKNLPENYLQYEKNKGYPGKLYVKDTRTGLVSTFSHFFKNIENKYPAKVISEIYEGVYSFYNIKDTVVIETSNYVVVDSYIYDTDEGRFKNTILPGVYIPKHTINSNLEKYINCFYVESEQNLYLCFLKLLPTLSASNYKVLYPAIYKINIDNTNVEQVYPLKNFDTTIYSLSSSEYRSFPEVDIRRIEGGKFSYKEKFGIFNLTYQAYNLNDIPFIVNEQFSVAAGIDKLFTYKPILHKPYHYVRDVNFSNPKFDLTLRHSATYSELIGYKDFNTFNYTLDKKLQDKFHFCSNISPVYLNTAGEHYVQFDWDSYIFGNVFIGCESIGVAKIDEVNIVDLRDGSLGVTLTYEDTYYRIKDFKFGNRVYTLSAYRPINTNGTLVTFIVQPSGFEYNGEIFCKDIINTYKIVEIVKRGNGEGVVRGLPACLDCGDICTFAYPQYGTITLIPSAAKESVFTGWIGNPCQGLASNCIATFTENTVLTAIFNKTPEYTISMTTNMPGNVPVVTNATNLSCNGYDTCTATFKEGEIALLSAYVPLGFILEDFFGSDCENTTPCPVLMTKNYSVTAVFLSSINTIEVYNIPPAQGLNAGTTYLSLCGDNHITSYSEKITVPTGTRITLSANNVFPYTFKNFAGSPCSSSIGNNFCTFLVTKNYSISSYFDFPRYTVSTITSGNGIYYIESSKSKSDNTFINIGTKYLKNTRNVSTAAYLSGETVTLTARGDSLGGTTYTQIVLLSSFGLVPRIIDSKTIELTIPRVTNNITVTALGVIDEFNFSVEKVGINTTTAKKHTVTVEIDGVLDTIGFDVSSRNYITVPGNLVKITPYLTPSYSDVLLYVGNSNDLYYEYTFSSPVLQVTTGTGSTFTVEATDILGVSNVFNLDSLTPPLISTTGFVLEVDNVGAPVYYIPSIDSEVVKVYYGKDSVLVKEEDSLPILMQDGKEIQI